MGVSVWKSTVTRTLSHISAMARPSLRRPRHRRRRSDDSARTRRKILICRAGRGGRRGAAVAPPRHDGLSKPGRLEAGLLEARFEGGEAMFFGMRVPLFRLLEARLEEGSRAPTLMEAPIHVRPCRAPGGPRPRRRVRVGVGSTAASALVCGQPVTGPPSSPVVEAGMVVRRADRLFQERRGGRDAGLGGGCHRGAGHTGSARWAAQFPPSLDVAGEPSRPGTRRASSRRGIAAAGPSARRRRPISAVGPYDCHVEAVC